LSDWQERVDTRTDPQVMLEHLARYRFVAPLVAATDVWLDLGCGTGIAGEALVDAGVRPGRIVLVDRDAEALAAAERRFAARETEPLALDLASKAGLAELEARMRALCSDRAGCASCFEVIEHLEDFGPLVALLVSLAASLPLTVALSVPNDAFWSLHNPYHHTVWGDGSFEEFRRLLPADAVVVHQVALHGTVLQQKGTDPASESAYDVSVNVRSDAVPTHFLVAFGPAVGALEARAEVGQLDLSERRAWERQRDADLAWLRLHQADLEYEIEQLRAERDACRAAAPAGAPTEKSTP